MRHLVLSLSLVFMFGCGDGHNHDHHDHGTAHDMSGHDMNHSSDGHSMDGDSDCAEGNAICEDMMIRHCVDGAYGEPEACPEGQMCMTMDDGMTHCM
ncbi:MAG: hypothetical protein CMH54_13990 [Myxococcales bacterium]|nr:hypothetical protein [Myxococcales bacterium]